jgi:hypothetical protein
LHADQRANSILSGTVSATKEINVTTTKHPEGTPPEGGVPQPKASKTAGGDGTAAVGSNAGGGGGGGGGWVWTGSRAALPTGSPMTSDRPCISVRGLMVHAGVKVTYLCHIAGLAVKVRMEDGSEEILHPHCFPELRQ